MEREKARLLSRCVTNARHLVVFFFGVLQRVEPKGFGRVGEVVGTGEV